MVFRDSFPMCPRCGDSFAQVGVGPRCFDRCRGCGGVWILQATLASMWREMDGGRELRLVPRAGRGHPLPCPRCREPMAQVKLLVVPLDLCREHGIWFDAAELETSLAAAAMPEDFWLHHFAAELRSMR